VRPLPHYPPCHSVALAICSQQLQPTYAPDAKHVSKDAADSLSHDELLEGCPHLLCTIVKVEAGCMHIDIPPPHRHNSPRCSTSRMNSRIHPLVSRFYAYACIEAARRLWYSTAPCSDLTFVAVGEYKSRKMMHSPHRSTALKRSIAMRALGAVHVSAMLTNFRAFAGTYKPAPFSDVDESMVDDMLNLNIKSVIYGVKYAMAAMKEKGTKGSIVINSSVMSHVAKSVMQGGGVYAATKSAADMLVQYAAVEGAESGALFWPHYESRMLLPVAKRRLVDSCLRLLFVHLSRSNAA
jgi:hypothetical protein